MKVIMLFFAILTSAFFSAGCGHIPRRTVTAGNTTHVDALVTERGHILCPSRIEIMVSNFSPGYLMDLSMGSRAVVSGLPAGASHKVSPPESPFRNSEELFTATIYRLVNGQKSDLRYAQQYVPMNGPTLASFTASEGYIQSEWHTPYSRFGYGYGYGY